MSFFNQFYCKAKKYFMKSRKLPVVSSELCFILSSSHLTFSSSSWSLWSISSFVTVASVVESSGPIAIFIRFIKIDCFSVKYHICLFIQIEKLFLLFFYLFSFDRQLWIANKFYLTRFKKVAQCRKNKLYLII